MSCNSSFDGERIQERSVRPSYGVVQAAKMRGFGRGEICLLSVQKRFYEERGERLNETGRCP
jgi:hypothetical protein